MTWRPLVRRRPDRRSRDLRAGGRAQGRYAERSRIIRRPSSIACCAIGWSAWPAPASRRWRSPRRSRAKARRRPRSTRRWRSARADAIASSSSTPICGGRAWRRCWGCTPTRACRRRRRTRLDRRLLVALRRRRALRAAGGHAARRFVGDAVRPAHGRPPGRAQAALRLRRSSTCRRSCRWPTCRPWRAISTARCWSCAPTRRRRSW